MLQTAPHPAAFCREDKRLAVGFCGSLTPCTHQVPPHLCPSLSLPLSLCIALILSGFSLYVPLSAHSLSHTYTQTLCLSLYVSLCLSLYLSLCMSLSVSLCINLSVSPCISLCLSLHQSLCLSLCLSIALSVPFSLYLCLSLCVSLSLSLSPCPSLSPSLPSLSPGFLSVLLLLSVSGHLPPPTLLPFVPLSVSFCLLPWAWHLPSYPSHV